MVSVVIPHRGEDVQLARCILALREQTYPRQSTEIVVVLNEHVQRPLGFPLISGEILLWQPHFYSYAARNTGIQSTSGAIIALLDSDALPEPEWLEEGINALRDKGDLAAGGINLTFSRDPLTPAACYEKLFAFDQEKNVSLGRATTANLFVRRQVLSSLGLFSNASESGEDFRWTSAAVKSGAVLRYAPSARVNHPARETIIELVQKAHRVTVKFPQAETAGGRVRDALARYWSLYILAPSRSKRALCTPSERSVAYLVALIVQVAKAIFFVKTLALAHRS